MPKHHLIPRQIKENGLKPRRLQLQRRRHRQIINEYTSEAGLRNLEREIGTLCRKVARRIAEGEKRPFPITRSPWRNTWARPKYYPEMDKEESQVGLATGLAWTQVGGEVLYVEASLINGKGELILTGQLGEVMQESARAALSYARANLSSFDVKDEIFDNLDIHIHVPAGRHSQGRPLGRHRHGHGPDFGPDRPARQQGRGHDR